MLALARRPRKGASTSNTSERSTMSMARGAISAGSWLLASVPRRAGPRRDDLVEPLEPRVPIAPRPQGRDKQAVAAPLLLSRGPAARDLRHPMKRCGAPAV